MKSKILLMIHYLELGGAESAFLGLLQSLDRDKAEVDVFVYDHRGPLMKYLSIAEGNYHLLPQCTDYSMLERPISELIKNRFWKLVIARVIGRYICGIDDKHNNIEHKDNYGASFFQWKYATKVLPEISQKSYDVAISFVTPHFFVLDHVSAKRKVGWIHTDYTKVYVNVEQELKMWRQLDTIVSISDDVTTTFCEVFPELRNKIVKIENILCPRFIKMRSNELTEEAGFGSQDKNFISLLTIGRYCKQKRLDQIPQIARLTTEFLQEKGDKRQLRWYIIGYGGPSDYIEKEIEKENQRNHVVVLGKKDNPYPYLKACDLYVQPSGYEGKSITVREAQILGKPVAITNYPTASSQIIDGVDGVILPMENSLFAKGLADLISDTQLQNSIHHYLSSHDYGNEQEVEKVYNL